MTPPRYDAQSCPSRTGAPRPRKRAKSTSTTKKRGTSVAPRRATVPHLPPGLLNLSTGSLYWLCPSRRRPRAAASVPRCPPRLCLGARFAAPHRRTVSPYRPPPPAAACPPCPLFQPSRPSLPPHRPILAAPSLPRRPPPLRRPGASELPLVRPGCGSAQRISSAAPLASAARAAAPVDLGCVPHPRSFSCTGRASPRWCGRGTRSR